MKKRHASLFGWLVGLVLMAQAAILQAAPPVGEPILAAAVVADAA